MTMKGFKYILHIWPIKDYEMKVGGSSHIESGERIIKKNAILNQKLHTELDKFLEMGRSVISSKGEGGESVFSNF